MECSTGLSVYIPCYSALDKAAYKRWFLKVTSNQIYNITRELGFLTSTYLSPKYFLLKSKARFKSLLSRNSMYASLDFPENTVYKFIHELELVGYLSNDSIS